MEFSLVQFTRRSSWMAAHNSIVFPHLQQQICADLSVAFNTIFMKTVSIFVIIIGSLRAISLPPRGNCLQPHPETTSVILRPVRLFFVVFTTDTYDERREERRKSRDPQVKVITTVIRLTPPPSFWFTASGHDM